MRLSRICYTMYGCIKRMDQIKTPQLKPSILVPPLVCSTSALACLQTSIHPYIFCTCFICTWVHVLKQNLQFSSYKCSQRWFLYASTPARWLHFSMKGQKWSSSISICVAECLHDGQLLSSRILVTSLLLSAASQHLEYILCTAEWSHVIKQTAPLLASSLSVCLHFCLAYGMEDIFFPRFAPHQRKKQHGSRSFAQSLNSWNEKWKSQWHHSRLHPASVFYVCLWMCEISEVTENFITLSLPQKNASLMVFDTWLWKALALKSAGCAPPTPPPPGLFLADVSEL